MKRIISTTRLLWQPDTRRTRFLWEEEVAQDRITVGKPSRKGLRSTWHRVPANCHSHTSFFRCMNSASTYAQFRNLPSGNGGVMPYFYLFERPTGGRSAWSTRLIWLNRSTWRRDIRYL